MTFAQAGIADQDDGFGLVDILAASQVQHPLFVELGDGTEVKISQFFENRETSGLDPLTLTVDVALSYFLFGQGC